MNARRSTFVLFLLLATSAGAEMVIPITTSAELEDLLSNGPGAVPDGAVIEMAAGTYMAPDDGFLLFNPGRSFTLRAATAGTVFLDGGGSERIFRIRATTDTARGAVVFEGLTFRNGFSALPAFGSAMTLERGDATFIDCVFEDNVNQSTGSGSGTVGIRQDSIVLFLRTILRDNTSRTSGAGAVIVIGSTLWCHECQFLRNRCNVPNHHITATGGGFTATSESTVYLSNSRFEANEAGFAGGAFNIKGSFADTEPTRMIAANSTFVDNVAQPDPGVVTNSPTAGGVANVEDNAAASFYNSRLVDNSASFAGAITTYRSTLEIHDSVLRGNFATGRESSNSTPRGGAIFATSDDLQTDGDNNRPTAQVTIRDSLFDGRVQAARRGSQTAAAHTGGCVYVSGDIFRHLGLGGVPQGGTQEENSARLDIAGTAFVDCDVENLIADNSLGGGIFSELSIITIDDSLFIDNDATGTFGAGGAMALARYADLAMNDTTFANNSAAGRGGAVFMVGAALDVAGCTFFKNTVPGDNVGSSQGAALYLGPQPGADLGIDGVVRNSRFVANGGLPVYDDDRECAEETFNTVTYENNDFYPTAFPPYVYRDSVMGGTGTGIVDVDGLNAMVVDRGNCETTDKAPLDDNVELTSRPLLGALLAAPPQIIDQAAVGDPQGATESSLAWAWCGECAELDGVELTDNTGLTAADTGVHSLMVFDNLQCSGVPDFDLTANIAQGATPAATLSADPVMIPGGGTSTLSWGTPGGTFLDSALDQGEGVLGTASGSVDVSPPLTTTYTFFAITEEGGDSAQAKVYVDEEPDDGEIFSDGFESGDTSAWSVQPPS